MTALRRGVVGRRAVRRLVVSIVVLLGCEPGVGSVSLRVLWDVPPEPGQTFYLRARVEERAAPTSAGSILASAGPLTYRVGEPVDLTLGAVPNGADRYAIVELRAGAGDALPVVFYGISEPFELRAERIVTVDVPIVLHPPESERREPSIAIVARGRENPPALPTGELGRVTLRTRSVGASSVSLANALSFDAGLREVALRSGAGIACAQEPDPADPTTLWDICEVTGWDLTARPPTSDPVHTVYARFRDAYGYESGVRRAAVAADGAPPQVASATLVPAVLRPGEETTLHLIVDEPLAAGAEGGTLTVVADASDAAAPAFTGPEAPTDSLGYTWLGLAGADPTPRDYTFAVALADALGNGGEPVALVDRAGSPLTLRVYGRAPRLLEAPAPARGPVGRAEASGVDGATVAFELTLAEDTPPRLDDAVCASCPRVLLDGVPVCTVARHPAKDDGEGRAWGFAVDCRVHAEAWEDVQRALRPSVTWTDRAGNAADLELPWTVAADLLAPQAATCTLDPPVVNAATQTLRFALTATEPLAAASLEWSPDRLADAAPEVSPDGRTYVWTFPADGLPEGPLDVRAQLEDAAGNVTDAACAAAGHVDRSAPTFPVVEVRSFPAPPDDAGGPLVLGDGDALRVTFDVVDVGGLAVDGVQAMLAAPTPIALTPRGAEACASLVSGQVRCELQLRLVAAEHAAAEGEWPVALEATDAAGNRAALETAAVRVDFTPPQVLAPAVTPPIARAGTRVVATFGFPEEVPDVSVTAGPLSFVPVPVAGGTLAFEHVVADPGEGPRPDGDYVVTASATDRAGNPAAALPLGPLRIDTTPPRLAPGSGEVSPSRVRADEPFTVRFRVGEELAEPPGVRVGARALTTCTPGPEDLRNWTCPHTALAEDGDGPRDVRVDLRDLAGNPGAEQIGTVTYDVTAPRLVGTFLLRDPPLASATPPGGPVSLSPTDSLTGGAVTARLVLFADEALDPQRPPTIAVRSGPGDLPFALESLVGGTATFLHVVSADGTAGDPEGTYAFELTWTDPMGNERTVPLDPTLVVDRTAPVLDVERVLFQRFPWGAMETGGEPRFTLVAEPGAAPDAVAVLAYREEQTTPGEVVGSAAVRDGAFRLDLLGGDLAEVWIAAVDASGVASTPLEVRRVEWVATMIGKRRGSTLENPHVYDTRRWFTSRWRQHDEVEAYAVENVGLEEDSLRITMEGAGRWLYLPPGSARPANVQGGEETSAAWDPARRATTVVQRFGDARMFLTDGTGWRPAMESSGFPSYRDVALVRDARRDRLVLLAESCSEWLGCDLELREWDGWAWTGPRVRDAEGDGSPDAWTAGDAAVFDPVRGTTTLLKSDSPAELGGNELWEWDGRSWRRHEPSGLWPARRRHAALAWDPQRERLVLFGGQSSEAGAESALLDDLWTWDGAGWSQPPVADPEGDGGPSPRRSAALVSDRARGRLVLFGGDRSAGEPSAPDGETWEWDGSSWTLAAPSGLAADEAPSPDGAPAAVYDEALTRMLVIQPSGVWAWDGERWTLRPTAPADPGDRLGPILVTDPVDGRVVLFGGGDPRTCEWDGEIWHRCVDPGDPEGDGSPPPSGAAGAGTPFGVLAFGDAGDGTLGRLWAWTGESWTALPPDDGDGAPPALRDALLAWDDAREVAVLHGGVRADGAPDDRTWEWDGASWRLACDGACARPDDASSENAGLVYDEGRGVSVLYAVTADTPRLWEFDGARWAALTSGAVMAPKQGFAMAYDRSRRRIVWVGSTFAEVVEWDGTSWTERGVASIDGSGRPSFEGGIAIAPVEGGRRLLAVGGRGESGAWLWDGGATARPGHVFRCNFARADERYTKREALSVRWVAGATVTSRSSETRGAQLLLWENGTWLAADGPDARNEAGDGPLGALSWSTDDPLRIAFMAHGSQDELGFAVVPAVPDEQGTSRISVDAVEVRVRYRRE